MKVLRCLTSGVKVLHFFLLPKHLHQPELGRLSGSRGLGCWKLWLLVSPESHANKGPERQVQRQRTGNAMCAQHLARLKQYNNVVSNSPNDGFGDSGSSDIDAELVICNTKCNSQFDHNFTRRAN